MKISTSTIKILALGILLFWASCATPTFEKMVKKPKGRTEFTITRVQLDGLLKQAQIVETFKPKGAYLKIMENPKNKQLMNAYIYCNEGPCDECRVQIMPGSGPDDYVVIDCFCIPKNTPECGGLGNGNSHRYDPKGCNFRLIQSSTRGFNIRHTCDNTCCAGNCKFVAQVVRQGSPFEGFFGCACE